jgi:hypothetical protein
VIEAYGPPNHYRVTLPGVPEHCFIGGAALKRAERFVEEAQDKVYVLCKCGRYEFNRVKVEWDGEIGTVWMQCKWNWTGYTEKQRNTWYNTGRKLHTVISI